MPADPYAPPKAVVSDPEHDRARGARPKEVKTAIWLILASIGLGLINALFDPILRRVFVALPIAASIMLVFTLGISALLVVFLARGKNWARIVFLVLSALGTVFMMVELDNAFRTWWPTAVVNLVQAGMTAAALYLMFTSPGSEWFRRKG